MAVVGLGLVGGSLVRALAGLELAPELVGWTPDPADAGAADASGALYAPVTTLADALDGAELVVLAAPLGASVDLLRTLSERIPPGATVTDVASLKAPMARAALVGGLGERFVGSHPMAGGEGRGFGASTPDLFRGATVWIVPGGADSERVARVEAMWTGLGAAPETMDSEDHDRLMALVSHVPQLTANALSLVLSTAGVAATRLGPGGRDMTRLGASSPHMWRDLLGAAPPELPDALRAVSRALDDLAMRVESGDAEGLAALMDRTGQWRRDS